MSREEKIYHIAAHYGYESQSRQLIEEMAELTVALNKWWRLNNGDMKIDRDLMVRYSTDIVEEIADVTIMLKQLQHLLEISDGTLEETMDWKLDRTIKRIENSLAEPDHI